MVLGYEMYTKQSLGGHVDRQGPVAKLQIWENDVFLILCAHVDASVTSTAGVTQCLFGLMILAELRTSP